MTYDGTALKVQNTARNEDLRPSYRVIPVVLVASSSTAICRSLTRFDFLWGAQVSTRVKQHQVRFGYHQIREAGAVAASDVLKLV